ncbi:MAG TPA: hypothetical protein VFU07_05635 [Candidatus Lumbricidophila sp.]|nr:hypothetical protein [Candidatus Lumbricidophila sp.]
MATKTEEIHDDLVLRLDQSIHHCDDAARAPRAAESLDTARQRAQAEELAVRATNITLDWVFSAESITRAAEYVHGDRSVAVMLIAASIGPRTIDNDVQPDQRCPQCGELATATVAEFGDYCARRICADCGIEPAVLA